MCIYIYIYKRKKNVFIHVNFHNVYFQMLIKEKAEALQEEVDDLLMLPSDIPSL